MARLLVERGAVLIDADLIAREVVAPGGPAYQPLLDRFGTGILAADGSIDRPSLAALVFNDPEALAALNAITHPAIGEEMARRRATCEGTDSVVLLDIPLLVRRHREEVGLDAVMVVDAPTEVALDRLVRLRGMDRGDAGARIATQISREERLAEADVVVDNFAGLDSLRNEVAKAWEWVESRRKSA